jgi:phosphatidylethanolamine-binding protein (PEBP) family uncharacterized protein
MSMKLNYAPSALAALFFTATIAASPSHAAEFAVAFEWGATPACSSGYPNKIDNPRFTLTDVPQGTVQLRFRLDDRDAPNFSHGGGRVDYSGEATIEPGAFDYLGPCPPFTHTYIWNVQARDAEGDVIGRTKVSRKFPE